MHVTTDAVDAQALRAALSAMDDDWESELSALFGLEPDYTSDERPAEKARPRTEPSKESASATLSRRQEIAALRAQVEELTSRVTKRRSSAARSLVPRTATVQVAEAQSAWERLAYLQQRRRFDAGTHNAKLRKRIKAQLQISRRALDLAKRAQLLDHEVREPAVASLDSYRGPHIATPMELQTLDGMARASSEIFSSGAFAARGDAETFRAVNFRRDTPALVGVDIQYEAAWMLPFGLDQVADAVWAQTLRPTHKERTDVFKDLYGDGSARVSQFISTPASIDWWGVCHCQLAARRFPPDPVDGSVLILLKTQGRAYYGAKWQGSAVGRCWLRIEQVLGTSASSSPITRVKWYRRTVLEPPEDGALSYIDRVRWTNTLVVRRTRSQREEEINWSIQVIDNLLLAPKQIVNRKRFAPLPGGLVLRG